VHCAHAVQAYRKFDILTSKHIESLRKFTKQIQDARLASNNDAIKNSLKLYDAALERYVTDRHRNAGLLCDGCVCRFCLLAGVGT
jgi:hypothetical protein